ncbi:hypothetical protein [Brucella pituitosa]|uniref:hypothetical protein n=1 Tax=Brucella pituitosa TaxID=571256 RepID=UPI000CFE7B4B|nr:hypothetical protein CQ062_23165 [Ochrobactrum sp. MYb68]
MRLELARLFLLERRQGDVFERKNLDGSQMTREQWLRAIFSQRIDFVHRTGTRVFVPLDNAPDGKIVGRIGREIEVIENEPPHMGLKEIARKQWKACLVIIDPTHHDDGQKLFIQENSGVGSGYGNFESLVRTINAFSPPEPFSLELNKISNQESFWTYVARNKGKVTSVTLEVTMPNMFGGSSTFEEDARRLRDQENARRIRETIENEDGLNPDTERMREAVSYATRGGGRVKAKAKNAIPYDSSKNKKTVEVEIENSSDGMDSDFWYSLERQIRDE